jgi:hypothetical protein
MRATLALLTAVLCLATAEAWATPEIAIGLADGGQPSRYGKRPAPDRLATATLGFFASYNHYDFPRTNEWLQRIVQEIEKTRPGMSLGNLETGVGVYGYLQMLIWEGIGFRFGMNYAKDRTTTMEPGGHGPVRAEVEMETAPFSFSYSVVKEIWIERVCVVAGVGVDQYRWDSSWLFYDDEPLPENMLEEWAWRGRGTGGHGFVEVGTRVAGLYILAGSSYHKGVVEMESTDSYSVHLQPKPRLYEEDIANLHFYGGVVFNVF